MLRRVMRLSLSNYSKKNEFGGEGGLRANSRQTNWTGLDTYLTIRPGLPLPERSTPKEDRRTDSWTDCEAHEQILQVRKGV